MTSSTATTRGLHAGSTARETNETVNQVLRGKTNNHGTVTLAHDGVATTTTVNNTLVGVDTKAFLFPQTAHAAAVVATTYVVQSDNVKNKSFKVTHSATSNADCTFSYLLIG